MCRENNREEGAEGTGPRPLAHSRTDRTSLERLGEWSTHIVFHRTFGSFHLFFRYGSRSYHFLSSSWLSEKVPWTFWSHVSDVFDPSKCPVGQGLSQTSKTGSSTYFLPFERSSPHWTVDHSWTMHE